MKEFGEGEGGSEESGGGEEEEGGGAGMAGGGRSKERREAIFFFLFLLSTLIVRILLGVPLLSSFDRLSSILDHLFLLLSSVLFSGRGEGLVFFSSGMI